MKICECTVENFGVLENFKFKFSDGLSSLVWDNGIGKTTLSVFIKAMLYGLEDTKRQKLSENERKHYLPWNSEVSRGSLTIEAGGKRYRIERSFGKRASEDTFRLYDTESGLLSNDYSEKIGEELFGIDADGFERTLFLSENNLSGKNENKSISAKLSDLTGSEGDIGELDSALKILDRERKFYRKKGGAGEISDIQSRMRECRSALADIEEKKAKYKELLSEEKEINSSLASLTEKKQRLDEQNDNFAMAELHRSYEKSYLERLSRLSEKSKEKDELSLFFRDYMPSASEIENMSLKKLELSELIGSISDKSDFSIKDNESNLEKIRAMKSLSKEAESDSVIIREKELQRRSELERADMLFPGGAPSQKELDSAIAKGRKKKRINPIIAVLLLIFTLGIGLIFYLGKRTENADAERLVRRYGRGGYKNTDEALYSLSSDFQLYTSHKASAERLATEISELSEALSKKTEQVRAFLIANGGKDGKLSLFDALSELELSVIQKKTRAGIYESERERKRARIEKLSRELSDFTARFPTVSGDFPIEEIKTAFDNLERISESVRRESEELSAFALLHGIDKSRLSEQKEQKLPEKIDTGSIISEISALQRRAGMLHSEMEKIMRELEFEEEYLITLASLEEKEKDALSRYNAILRADKYLNLASQSITTKYLSKTRRAFITYADLIAKDGAKLELDTSFSVRRSEGAQTMESDSYSRGTRDLYALAVRFALIDSLYEKEAPFIVLDDPFAYFDDGKLARAKALIRAMAKSRQIIYLTPTKSREI